MNSSKCWCGFYTASHPNCEPLDRQSQVRRKKNLGYVTSVCLPVCMYGYNIYIYLIIYLFIHLFIYSIYTHTCEYICPMQVYLYNMCVYVSMSVCTTCVYMYLYIYTPVHVYMYMYVYKLYMYIYCVHICS